MNDLLAPRYKVIAPWPSLGDDVEVGFIYEKCTEYMCKHMDRYPHLFRKLEWWEERKPEEMPEYVEIISNSKRLHVDGKEYKYEFINGSLFRIAHKNGGGLIVGNFIPATEQEYLCTKPLNHE